VSRQWVYLSFVIHIRLDHSGFSALHHLEVQLHDFFDSAFDALLRSIVGQNTI